MTRRDKRTHKPIDIKCVEYMTGKNVSIRYENYDGITFFVSPAVYELLHDEQVSDTVAKQVEVAPFDVIVDAVCNRVKENI
jgi:hypothetical protein